MGCHVVGAEPGFAVGKAGVGFDQGVGRGRGVGAVQAAGGQALRTGGGDYRGDGFEGRSGGGLCGGGGYGGVACLARLACLACLGGREFVSLCRLGRIRTRKVHRGGDLPAGGAKEEACHRHQAMAAGGVDDALDESAHGPRFAL